MRTKQRPCWVYSRRWIRTIGATIIGSTDEILRFANPVIAEFFQTTSDAVVGKPVQNFFVGESHFSDAVALLHLKGTIENLVATGQTWTGENKTVNISGRIIEYDGEQSVLVWLTE